MIQPTEALLEWFHLGHPLDMGVIAHALGMDHVLVERYNQLKIQDGAIC
ncbi:hypothetical protein ABIC22_005345 [Paenibacillus sp. PvP094]